jgi:protein-S-isoprenylcysteine O-methyltransferase Ste14
LFWRAVFAFIALPGMVAFGMPAFWLWKSGLPIQHPWGLTILAAGSMGLIWCVRDFYVQGKGTLAPWTPPRELVVAGLYRYSRNPMYVCVVLVLIGWATSFGSLTLFGYAAVTAVAFHLRVVYGEEPWLLRRHGARWQTYTRRVPRWLGFGGTLGDTQAGV